MKKLVLWALFPLFLFSAMGRTESLRNYQEDIQRIFLREAASKSQFIQAVQTARLLGYLEFMEPEAFSKFSQCMNKEKNWDVLSAKTREHLLNSCRTQGRMVSGSPGPLFAPGVVSPAASQKQEQELTFIKRELSDIREMVEKLSQDVRQNQEKVTEALSQISRTPSQIAPPSAPEQAQPLY
ncbi:MAG: hypothetical protein HYY61_04840 [Deltaproteobacteria bacterium]|nr:hypothetical protein [Deltaproteobacteria bacterium]